jgi:N-acetylneuraminic acid mutarotase
MNKKHSAQAAFFNLRILVTLLLCAVAACALLNRPLLAFLRSETLTNVSQRTLTFAERVAYQRAIEEVYWRHRIWPKERPDPKPSLDKVMSQAQSEKKVADYLRKSQGLENYWQRPIAAEQLQAEMDRMAQQTKAPEVLRELFEALGNDPFVIAECLARPLLSERLVTDLNPHDRRFYGALKPRPESWRRTMENQAPKIVPAASTNYMLPTISDAATGCTPDAWTATTTTNTPDVRAHHAAVWTGTEMIVWGGNNLIDGDLNTGGRYNPATDSWIATSTANAPAPRAVPTAVWTGTEMIVWGGFNFIDGDVNTGGRYNPVTDSWIATSTTNAPVGRESHTAVWTGSTMIIWGGFFSDGNNNYLNTGGRYSPNTNSWTATSVFNSPAARETHGAVWTGDEMIVWGGLGDAGYFDTGGRYNPATDSWTATNTANAPVGRNVHGATWTGKEMIIWGGSYVFIDTHYLNTGGRYNPNTDSWTATSIIDAPEARTTHTAVWTGNEMIVWGGQAGLIGHYFDTGGRYDPSTDTWTATSTNNVPDGRYRHTAVWTDNGNEMIVWGGILYSNTYTNTGGRYCGQAGAPTPTPTPCMGRCTPTPRPRPTPAPRP